MQVINTAVWVAHFSSELKPWMDRTMSAMYTHQSVLDNQWWSPWSWVVNPAAVLWAEHLLWCRGSLLYQPSHQHSPSVSGRQTLSHSHTSAANHTSLLYGNVATADHQQTINSWAVYGQNLKANYNHFMRWKIYVCRITNAQSVKIKIVKQSIARWSMTILLLNYSGGDIYLITTVWKHYCLSSLSTCRVLLNKSFDLLNSTGHRLMSIQLCLVLPFIHSFISLLKRMTNRSRWH